VAENTHARYKRVLEEIADGAENPAALATQALRSRKVEPNYEKRREAEARRVARKARIEAGHRSDLALYNEWLVAGRPAVAKFAREHAMHPTTMVNHLARAERGMPFGRRRMRAPGGPELGYPTRDELYAREDASAVSRNSPE